MNEKEMLKKSLSKRLPDFEKVKLNCIKNGENYKEKIMSEEKNENKNNQKEIEFDFVAVPERKKQKRIGREFALTAALFACVLLAGIIIAGGTKNRNNGPNSNENIAVSVPEGTPSADNKDNNANSKGDIGADKNDNKNFYSVTPTPTLIEKTEIVTGDSIESFGTDKSSAGSSYPVYFAPINELPNVVTGGSIGSDIETYFYIDKEIYDIVTGDAIETDFYIMNEDNVKKDDGIGYSVTPTPVIISITDIVSDKGNAVKTDSNGDTDFYISSDNIASSAGINVESNN